MKRSKDDEKDHSTGNVNNSSATLSSTNSINETNTNNTTVRTTGRVKKPKTVYDPSDNYITRPPRSIVPTTTSTLPAPATNTAVSSTLSIKAGSKDGIVGDQPKSTFDTCTKCGKSEPKRGSGHKSNFLACKTCLQKWHYDCLFNKFENSSNARKKFRCEKCGYCSICNSYKNIKSPRELILCSYCAEAFHLDCHCPTILRSELSNPNWKCRKCSNIYDNNKAETSCEQSAAKTKSKSNGVSLLRKSTGGIRKQPADLIDNGNTSSKLKKDDAEALQTSGTSSSPSSAEGEGLELPQTVKLNGDELNGLEPLADNHSDEKPVQTWTVDQVVNYIKKRYPMEANVFKYQDIDGASLMLLTRQDIVDRFGLKLGPSLRLFELVTVLQSRADDVTLAWCD